MSDVAPLDDKSVRGVTRVHDTIQLEPDGEVRHSCAQYPLDGLTFNRSQIRELQIDVEKPLSPLLGVPVEIFVGVANETGLRDTYRSGVGAANNFGVTPRAFA